MTATISSSNSFEYHVVTVGPHGDAIARCFDTAGEAVRYLKRVGAMPTRNPRRKAPARNLLSLIIMGPGDFSEI